MNLKKLMKIKDDNTTLYAVCYKQSGYHSQYWNLVKLKSKDLDNAIQEAATIVKNAKELCENVYIVDYSSRPSSLAGNDIYCYLAFKCKFHAYTGMGGYYSTEGIDNPNNWRDVNGKVRLY